jgi:tRNA(adenine34) deaminase
MNNHIAYMKQCVSLGKEAMLNNNPPVGSILVNGDNVIGIGVESGKSSKDITRHAEIEAVKDALKKPNTLKDCTLYATHEPCLMCSYVLRHHNLKTIVYGAEVDHVGGISSDLKVMLTTNVPSWGKPPIIIKNILKEECLNLSKEFNRIQSENSNEKHK